MYMNGFVSVLFSVFPQLSGERFRSSALSFPWGRATCGKDCRLKSTKSCAGSVCHHGLYIYIGPCLPPHHTTVLPKRCDDWPLIAANVQARHYYLGPWNLPHCPGAMDGKHVMSKASSNSGSIPLSDLHRHVFTCPDGFGALTPT